MYHDTEPYPMGFHIMGYSMMEWTAVTLLNAVYGCVPSDMATGSPAEIEEERRLLYVAMTRAGGRDQAPGHAAAAPPRWRATASSRNCSSPRTAFRSPQTRE